MTTKTDLLIYIHPGMEVYDLEDNKVGTVKYVKLPEGVLADVDAMDLENGDLRRIFTTLNSSTNIPVQDWERLPQDGFVKVNTGLLQSDRYILPDHIRSVSAKSSPAQRQP